MKVALVSECPFAAACIAREMWPRIKSEQGAVQPHSRQFVSLVLCGTLLVSVIAIIFVSVATAGSSANYKPITNVYVGQADISHINVTKVIPSVGPILTILGTALSANATLDQIFGSLKNIAGTPALTPLLTILSNAQNTTGTINALTSLAPLAITGTSNTTNDELDSINIMLANSTNVTATLLGLEGIVSSQASTNISSSLQNLENVVFQILMSSKDPLATTQSLVALNNLTLAEKAQLAPVFGLFTDSKDITSTFDSLLVIANSSLPVSLQTSVLQLINSTISNGNDLSSLNSTLSRTASSLPGNTQDAVKALVKLFESTTDAKSTLSILSSIVSSNLTQSPSAKTALGALSIMVDNSNNNTILLNGVETLASSADAASATSQLVSLEQIFQGSENKTTTIDLLLKLQSDLAKDKTTIQYIPFLFDLMRDSFDPAKSFQSLLELTAWVKTNTEIFLPLLTILGKATAIKPISELELKELTPSILEYLGVPVRYRLSIFTLCRVNLENKILNCTNSHAVQNLDFRSIIWDNLLISEFNPYLGALNITKDNLYLEGKLLKRQHEYVPAVRAALACNILTIITAFFMSLFAIYLFVRPTMTHYTWFTLWSLAAWLALFNGIAATIIAAMVHIIKSGTHQDNYGVTFEQSSPYYGLMWTSFSVCFIFLCYCTFIWFKDRAAISSIKSLKSTVIPDTESSQADEKNSATERSIVRSDD